MTSAEIHRLLLILQRERQKGFQAWEKLVQMSDEDREGDDTAEGGNAQGSSPPIRLPLSARSDGPSDN